MFCDEKIEKVYIGKLEDDRKGNICLDCYYDMALHISGSYREILETEHYYISLQHDGVFLLDKTGSVYISSRFARISAA